MTFFEKLQVVSGGFSKPDEDSIASATEWAEDNEELIRETFRPFADVNLKPAIFVLVPVMQHFDK